ncbi:MAG TPA: hypothetical protein VGH73_14045 [Thermoanaerobaculia bacterium]
MPHGHGHRVPDVGGAAQPAADLLLLLGEDLRPGGRLVARGGEVGGEVVVLGQRQARPERGFE